MWDNYKYLSLLLILFGITCCNTTEPPNGQSINLKLEDVSCTEAWITLTTTNLQLPTTVTLKQINLTGNTKSQILNLTTQDSLLYVDSLLPKQTYTFQSFTQPINQSEIKSNIITVQTLDTTSHNFTFETFTFGDIGNSVLFDVAIINENNIWAVGEILIADTSQNGYTTYNAVHWDGSQWELKRITVEFRGNLITPSLEGAFAFSATDIWFVGSLPIQGDGVNWLMYDLRTTLDPNTSLSKAWGYSSNDIYFVGNNGNIAWYNGTIWRKIYSGTDVDIQDIWGITGGNSDSFILCAASNAIAPGEHKILRIINSAYVDTVSWISNKRVHSVWMDSKYQLFACGDGVFKNCSTNIWKEQDELTFVFTERLRGTGKNDVFVVGHFGLLAHYNGASWKEYPEASAALVYTSLDIENNLTVTVGYTQTEAVIQIFTGN